MHDPMQTNTCCAHIMRCQQALHQVCTQVQFYVEKLCNDAASFGTAPWLCHAIAKFHEVEGIKVALMNSTSKPNLTCVWPFPLVDCNRAHIWEVFLQSPKNIRFHRGQCRALKLKLFKFRSAGHDTTREKGCSRTQTARGSYVPQLCPNHKT